jgi:hypothetical protein
VCGFFTPPAHFELINAVLTLLFTNPEGLAVDTVWAPIFNSSGIADMAYIPPVVPVRQSDWPTLGELINSGKRVIVFMDFNRYECTPLLITSLN